ncbi:MAG TPA: NFACT family protein, partial [Alphaproteobacteria bacterium]|nr:NFACT family protein [Alphaproteobacteria bacterium]
MKNEISSLELYYLTKEFKVLEGSKIDRIYHSKNNYKELTIVCHVTSKGRIMLRTTLPGIIFLDDSKDASDSPTGFGMMLRKYLEGGRIRLIEQKDFERVLTIIIETREKEEITIYNLVIELFSKGNMIFCDEKFKILNILDEQEWKDRSLKRLETYKYPHSRLNTLNITEDEFVDAVKNSGKDSFV